MEDGVGSSSLTLRSSSTKSMTVARLSCDLKKYSCNKTFDVFIVVVVVFIEVCFVISILGPLNINMYHILTCKEDAVDLLLLLCQASVSPEKKCSSKN